MTPTATPTPTPAEAPAESDEPVEPDDPDSADVSSGLDVAVEDALVEVVLAPSEYSVMKRGCRISTVSPSDALGFVRQPAAILEITATGISRAAQAQ